MADEIRIPIEIDDSKGLADLSRFAKKANKVIDGIAPGRGGKPGEVHIPVSVDATGAVAGLNRLGTQAQRTTAQLNKLPNTSDQATQSLINLSRVAQDAPYGFLGIANNLNPLLESFQRLKTSTGSNVGALKALGSQLTGAGGIGLALGVASSLLVVFGDKLFGSGKKAEEAEDKLKKYKETVSGIFSEVAKEATQVTSLMALLKSETETRQRKLDVIKELQRIQPEIFNGLKLEGDAVIGLDAAYKNYLANLKTVIAVKIKQAQLEQLITKQLERQGVTLTASEKKWKDGLDALNDGMSKIGGVGGDETAWGLRLKKERKAANAESVKLENDIAQIIKDLTELSKGIDLDTKKSKGSDPFDNIISKAKEIAAFLKDSFVVTYQFSPLDDKATALKKAQDFLDDVSKGKLKVRTDLFVSPSAEPPKKEEIEKVKTVIEQGFEKGIIIPVRLEQDSGFINDDQVKILDKYKEKFKEIGIQMYQLKGIDWMNMNAEKLEALLKAKTELTNIAGLITQTLTPAFDSMFDAILAGEDPLQSFFKSIQQSVVQLIKKLIAAAIQAAVFAAIFPGGGGFGSRFGKALGVPGFAMGGIVSGPTLGLVGEGARTSKRNPEIIAPLDQLKGFFAGMLNNVVNSTNAGRGVGTSGGGFTAPAFVELRASGNDLVGVLTLTQAKQNRSF